MKKISILVAVYNGEKYLQKCLDSLYCQTYKNIEIVCINDASTDGSVEIIRQQMAKDDRIKLVEHKENKGLAKAWNTGINVCTGDVIGYLDSDDWYDIDTIEKLMKVFNEHDDADCVLYRCVKVDRQGNHCDYEGRVFESMDGREAFLESLNWNIHGVYAGKAELFRKYPVDDTRRHFSNDNTTRIHYYNAKKVYQSDAPYYYLYNPDSITNQVTTSRMDFLAATQSMKRQLQEIGVDRDILCRYETERMKILVDCYLFYFVNRKHFNAEERRYCLSELKADWEGIDASMLDKKLTRKMGYKPFKKSWIMFRLQEELYFLLKRITGRM